MGGCSAMNCTNSNAKGVRMFNFPSEKTRREQWKVNCRRLDGTDKKRKRDWSPGPKAQLCISHFEDSQFEQNRQDGWKKLKQTAVPTLFNIPNPPKSVTPKRVKGVGYPKPNTLLSAHLNVDDLNDDNPMSQRVTELEAENARLKEELAKSTAAFSFLSEEQKSKALMGKSSIKQWSQQEIVNGLKLKFAVGKHGYDYLRATGYPSPAYSTLNRRTKCFKMGFGVLESFLPNLKLKVQMMHENDRWCSIMIDEMEIKKNKDFDTSTKSFVGGVSLGSKLKPGNHYTVVLLRGMRMKWKQVIAHEVTGPSTSGPAMKELVEKSLHACKDLGLTVKALVSDMGSNNRAMWRELGINVSRNVRDTTFNTEAGAIHGVADVPHLLKNLRTASLKRRLFLPKDVCENEGLPTNSVSTGYIKKLWIDEIDAKTSLRSLHHLNKEHLFPSHFSTMNVAHAVQFFSIKTAAALEKAVRLGNLDKEALTTAWWIRLIHEWFELMSARHVKCGITRRNKEKKLEFLENFISVVENTKFGKCWKPLQTGMILSTLSVIGLVNEAFAAGFKYFLPGRLSQDALENVFSQIRRKAGKKPTALKARRALKMVCVSQFISDLKNVSYFSDNDHHLFSLKKSQDPLKNVENLPKSTGNHPLTCSDENEVYYIAGVTLNGILKRKMCDNCLTAANDAVDSNEENIPEYLKFLTTYSDKGGLKYPSSGFYRICREAEREVQHHKNEWLQDECPVDGAVISAISRRCDNVQMPICCNLKENIIQYYLNVRCKGIVRHIEHKSTYEASVSSAPAAKKRKIS